MALEKLKSRFGIGVRTPTPNSDKEGGGSTEQVSRDEESSEDEDAGLSRPPGWGPVYGTYDKPVFPTEDGKLVKFLESLDRASDITSFRTHMPPMGANDEHIEMYLYTVGSKSDERTLVIDVHIHDFSEWLPEEKGRYEYPEELLGDNGPYYMNLAHDFRDVFQVGPFAFTFVEYDEEEDLAIYSAEEDLMVINNLNEY